MKYKNLFKLAEDLSEKYTDKNIVINEHEGIVPTSYMAFSNLKNLKYCSEEILSILNDDDDLPQWSDDLLAVAKNNVEKVLDFIKSEKSKEANQHTSDIIKLAAGKYDHIDFKPPQSVADAATRGLELRKGNGGKGGLSAQQAHKEGIGSGVSRAVSLKNRQNLSPTTVRRMKSFFARHEKNKSPKKGEPLSKDKGYISWCLWGGNPGQSWVNKICNQMDAADKK